MFYAMGARLKMCIKQGNKGATAVRLQFTPMPFPASAGEYEGKPATLTFVNTHLAAFDEMFEKRNADFHDLSKRLQFDSGLPADDSTAPNGGYGPSTVQLNIFETDVLFWLVRAFIYLAVPILIAMAPEHFKLTALALRVVCALSEAVGPGDPSMR